MPAQRGANEISVTTMEVPYYSLMRFLWLLMLTSFIIFITLNFLGSELHEFIGNYGNDSKESTKKRNGENFEMNRSNSKFNDLNGSLTGVDVKKVVNEIVGKLGRRRNLNFNDTLAQDWPLSKFFNRLKINNLSVELQLVRKRTYYFPVDSVLSRKMSRTKLLESKMRTLDKLLQEDSNKGLLKNSKPLTIDKYRNFLTLKKKLMKKRQVNEDGYFIVVNGDRNSDYIVPLSIDGHSSGDNLIIPEKGRRHYYIVPQIRRSSSSNRISVQSHFEITAVTLLSAITGLWISFDRFLG